MKHQVRPQPPQDKSDWKELQIPTQSRFKHWVRPGCAGLHPVQAWNTPILPPVQETAQPPWALSPPLSWPHEEKASPSSPAWASHVPACAAASHPPAVHTLPWRTQRSPWVPGMLLSAPKAIPSLSWTSPSPTASPSRPRDPAHDYVSHPPWNSLQLLIPFL